VAVPVALLLGFEEPGEVVDGALLLAGEPGVTSASTSIFKADAFFFEV
jgi:hypothetical protein